MVAAHLNEWCMVKKRIQAVLTLLLAFSSAALPQNQITTTAPPGVIFEALALSRDLSTPQWPKYRSPTALVPTSDGEYLFVAEQTAKRILMIRLATKKVVKTILLPNEVTGLAVVASGRTLYATCSSDLWPQGMVCEVATATGKVLRRLPGGAGSRSPVLSSDEKLLYLCNQHSDDVYCIDIASGTVRSKFPSHRQPYSCALTPDGSTLVIANCLPDQKSTDELTTSSKVVLVNTREQRRTATLSLPAGSHSVFSVAVSPDGCYAFVTHLVAQFTLPTTTIEGGWIHTNNCAVIDIKKEQLLNDFTLDDENHGAANPWEVACTRDMSTLCIVHAGSNDFTTINLSDLLQKAHATAGVITRDKGLRFTGCTHDLTALSTIKHRTAVVGKGPRALAIIGRRVYTAGYFGNAGGIDSIEMFDLPPDASPPRPAGGIALGSSPPLNATRTGEMVFSDGTVCHQSWQSCFSCHPFSRGDGLNWTLGNDPTSAPRNAKSMLYSWWTPPTGWTGKRHHASESIRLGFKNSLFVPTNEALAATIDTFLMYLKPVASPALVKGTLSPAALRGRAVFFNQSACDCIGCHRGPLFTDLHFHSSRITFRWDVLPNWDTPSLIETWRDAPYSHLGSFDTLETLLRYDGHSSSAQKGLNDKDFSDLVHYILSL